MKTLANNSITKAVRNVTAATLIAGTVAGPSTASAGLADRIQQVRGNVTELKNTVQGKVENIQDKIEDVSGEALEQVGEMVQSMFEFVKQIQAGYKEFVGADKCGARSPCGVFRAKLRGMMQAFIALPGELQFVEHVPPAVRQLEKMIKLVDFLPPVILFASEKALGGAFDEIGYRIELVRYAASQAPKLPTMDELSQASSRSTVETSNRSAVQVSTRSTVQTSTRSTDQTSTRSTTEPDPSFPYCVEVLETKKPHRELLSKTLEALGDLLWDSADLMEENKTVGTAPGATTSFKNPIKEAVQLVGFVVKSIRQVIEIKVAATASVCALRGYKAPAN